MASDPGFEGILKRGSNGDAYEIELDVAARYIIGREQFKEEQQRARQSELAQLGLDLGLSSANVAPGLTIADRKALMEEEMVAIKLAEKRRELVEKASVEGAIAQLLVWHQQQQDTFTARLAKRLDLTRQQQVDISSFVRSDLAEFARRLRELGNIEATGNGDGSDASSTALDRPAL